MFLFVGLSKCGQSSMPSRLLTSPGRQSGL